MVGNLLLINFGVFLVDVLSDSRLGDWLSLDAEAWRRPWLWWQLLTNGFVHDTLSQHWFLHITFNMLGLWIFGPEIEARYGRREFLRLYLAMILVGSVAWLTLHQVMYPGQPARLLGASGAVTGLIVLFVLHDPRRTLLVWGILPAPAWLIGGLIIVQNLLGFSRSVSGASDHVAYEVHLTGAVFAFLYYRQRWYLGDLVPQRLSLAVLRRPPRLRVHQPQQDEQDLTAQVDRILEKISRHGEASLTPKERKTLEDASRRYQQRRR